MSLRFVKAQATGNDFIFIQKADLKDVLTPQKIASLCDRRFGVGADGLVIVDKTEKGVDFVWDFYNADGGPAEMCGNAARCATLLFLKDSGKTDVLFKTKIGLVRGRALTAENIEVDFEIAQAPLKEVVSLCDGQFAKGYLINTGVPHCVIPTANPWELRRQAARLAPYIKTPEFGPAGANLTFFTEDSEKIKAITLERGVNDFTLSCGTGVIAAAIVYEKRHGKSVGKALSVETPGGVLQVRTVSGEGKFMVSLSGPAHLVYKGDI